MRKINKIIALLLCFSFLIQQVGFAQVAGELDLSAHFAKLSGLFAQESFRPLHLRYLQYLPNDNTFKLLLDKGDTQSRGHFPSGLSGNSSKESVPYDAQKETKNLLNYFFIGLSLPNDSFWVNLRPDAEDNIIDDYLAKTDLGKVLLEADLQLKKDTAQFTSPQTLEGKEYWDKLYKKAAELFGSDNITIPTLTRPWIVPGEIIIRESTDNAYIYKATLKVMLEQDYLKGSATYNFQDDRLKALNEYSSQLIRELIIPKLTKDVNSAKRYAPLRQVYYSLILAQWFKSRASLLGAAAAASLRTPAGGEAISGLIDSRNLTNLISQDPWSKTTYFNAYKQSFSQGEYNIKEPVYTPYGQVIRSYMSGGVNFDTVSSAIEVGKIAGSLFKDMPRVFNNNNIYVECLSSGELRIGNNGIDTLNANSSIAKEQSSAVPAFTPQEPESSLSEQQKKSASSGMERELPISDEERINLLRQFLKTQNTEINDWLQQQEQNMRPSEAMELPKALSVIGMAKSQMEKILDKIVVVNLPENSQSEELRSILSGVIVKTNKGPKIIFPKKGLVRALQNKEYLAETLQQLLETQLIERGVSSDEARIDSMQAGKDFLGGSKKFGEEFDDIMKDEIYRKQRFNDLLPWKAEQILTDMDITEVFLMDDAPDGGKVYQVMSRTVFGKDRYVVLLNASEEIVGLAFNVSDSKNSYGSVNTESLQGKSLGDRYSILPKKAYPLFAVKFNPLLEQARQGIIKIEDRRLEYGSKRFTEAHVGQLFFSLINMYYGIEELKNDFINNAIIRSLVRRLGAKIFLAYNNTIRFIHSHAQGLSVGGHTLYDLHPLRTMEDFPLHHTGVVAHEFAHELFRLLNDEDRVALRDYFLRQRGSLADTIRSDPSYMHNKGDQLLTEMVAFITGFLADGYTAVYTQGGSDPIQLRDVDILIKYGFLPVEFKPTETERQRFLNNGGKIETEYLLRVYPQTFRNTSSPIDVESSLSPAIFYETDILEGSKTLGKKSPVPSAVDNSNKSGINKLLQKSLILLMAAKVFVLSVIPAYGVNTPRFKNQQVQKQLAELRKNIQEEAKKNNKVSVRNTINSLNPAENIPKNQPTDKRSAMAIALEKMRLGRPPLINVIDSAIKDLGKAGINSLERKHLLALLFTESDFVPRRSRTGAEGILQIMPSTVEGQNKQKLRLMSQKTLYGREIIELKIYQALGLTGPITFERAINNQDLHVRVALAVLANEFAFYNDYKVIPKQFTKKGKAIRWQLAPYSAGIKRTETDKMRALINAVAVYNLGKREYVNAINRRFGPDWWMLENIPIPKETLRQASEFQYRLDQLSSIKFASLPLSKIAGSAIEQMAAGSSQLVTKIFGINRQLFKDKMRKVYRAKVALINKAKGEFLIEAIPANYSGKSERPYLRLFIAGHDQEGRDILFLDYANTWLSGLDNRGIAQRLLGLIGPAVPDGTILAFETANLSLLKHLAEGAGFSDYVAPDTLPTDTGLFDPQQLNFFAFMKPESAGSALAQDKVAASSPAGSPELAMYTEIAKGFGSGKNSIVLDVGSASNDEPSRAFVRGGAKLVYMVDNSSFKVRANIERNIVGIPGDATNLASLSKETGEADAVLIHNSLPFIVARGAETQYGKQLISRGVNPDDPYSFFFVEILEQTIREAHAALAHKKGKIVIYTDEDFIKGKNPPVLMGNDFMRTLRNEGFVDIETRPVKLKSGDKILITATAVTSVEKKTTFSAIEQPAAGSPVKTGTVDSLLLSRAEELTARNFDIPGSALDLRRYDDSRLEQAREILLSLIDPKKNEIAKKVTYHGPLHWNELLEFVDEVIPGIENGIKVHDTKEDIIFLARLAAYMHDAGYYLPLGVKEFNSLGHEERSISFVRESQGKLNLSDREVKALEFMIRLTEVKAEKEFAEEIKIIDRILGGLNSAELSGQAGNSLLNIIPDLDLNDKKDLDFAYGILLAAKVIAAADLYAQSARYISMIPLLWLEFGLDASKESKPTIVEQIFGSLAFHKSFVEPGRLEILLNGEFGISKFIPAELREARQNNLNIIKEFYDLMAKIKENDNVEQAKARLRELIRNDKIIMPEIAGPLKQDMEDEVEKLSSGSALENKSASSVVEDNTKGGIDLRALPIATEQVPIGIVPAVSSSFRDSPLRGQSLKLDNEWQQIENMLSGGIVPSADRIKEYLQSCCSNSAITQETDKVLSCLAEILRMEEERVENTEPALKELLSLLESDKPADQMQVALAKITVVEKEPKALEQ